MRARFPAAALALLTLLAAAAAPRAQAPKPPYGAASPQEVVATVQRASAANDPIGALPVIAPPALKGLANEGLGALLMVLAFSDPDDQFPGAKTPPKAALDKKRKDYQQAVSITRQTLQPFGLDSVIGKPPLADATKKSLESAIDKADNVVLVTSLMQSLEQIGPLLGMNKDAKPDSPFKLGDVSGYKITGDKATATDGTETLDFVRIAGRWYLSPPEKSAGGATASSPSSAAGRPSAQAPAPRATAAGKEPEIVVGGVQIANVAVPKDDFSARPFDSGNGTKILLWIKMPAGQGLIEIDEDASLLESFTDDKGTTLGGEFESFPDEFEDSTGGTIKVESSAVPAAGATSLSAQGTIAMSVATGTRKARVTNVALRNDTVFKLGTTTVTVADLETSDEDQTFNLKLPRQTLIGIKDIKFFDARNQPIEGRRTSTGYFGDDGELGLRVTTKAKSLTLEFETWQGLRTLKVPFNVRAGLSLR